MRNPILFLFGLATILLGVAFLFDNAFGFGLWRLLWPIALIVAGIALIAQRNKSSSFVGKRNHAFISEIQRNGRWLVADERFSAFIADIVLDLGDADIPKGETVYEMAGFIGDITIRVPDGVAVMLSSSSFISDVSVLGLQETGFFGPVTLQSDDYEFATRRIRIEARHFISDITVKVSSYSSVEMIEEKEPYLLS